LDDDTTSAAEHQQMLEEAQQRDWQWWPSYHKAMCERQKAERDSFAATEQAIRDWIDGK